MNNSDQTQKKTGQAMIFIACLVLLGLLTLLFGDLLDRHENPNRDLAAYAGVSAGDEVVLRRGPGGHYMAPGLINGEPVRFILDTGASQVSVPGDVADRLGLRPGRPSLVSTANGTIEVYSVLLDQVALGSIAQDNVRAHINPHMEGDVVLLGMSFMKHLELVQKGNTLTLRR